MVDEFLSERERADQLKHWFMQNWLTLVVGVAIGLGGLYGYRWWQSHQLERSAAAEQRFSQMLDALARNDKEQVARLGDELAGEYAGTPYADHAALVLARADVAGNELERAAGRLAKLMDGANDPELRLVARLRLARVQAALGQPDQALATLAGAAGGPVDARIEELRGDVLASGGDTAGALAAYQAARAAAGTSGLVDGELLELKIDQLVAARQAD